jgi:hypothetical protein
VLDRELDWCLELVLEGGSGAQCTDIMFGVKLDSVA